GQFVSGEACQRFAALRERNRIFEVLRLGTPIVSGLGKQNLSKIQTPVHFLSFSLFSAPQSCSRFAARCSLSSPLVSRRLSAPLHSRFPCASQPGWAGKST